MQMPYRFSKYDHSAWFNEYNKDELFSVQLQRYSFLANRYPCIRQTFEEYTHQTSYVFINDIYHLGMERSCLFSATTSI